MVHIVAVMLDEVKGIEDRGIGSTPPTVTSRLALSTTALTSIVKLWP
jgi:hypothetical protein